MVEWDLIVEEDTGEIGCEVESDDETLQCEISETIDFGTAKINALAKKTITELTLEDLRGVTEIPAYFCSNCTKLKSVKIPNTVTRIGDIAFYSCHLLSVVEFEENSQLTTIGHQAFRGSPNASVSANALSIKVPEKVTKIGNFCFSDGRITEVILPEGLKELCQGALQSCHYLKELTLPKTLTTLGISPLAACTAIHTFKADFRNLTSVSGNVISLGRYNSLQNAEIKNIKYNITITKDNVRNIKQITPESLIKTAYELIDTGAVKRFTIGSKQREIITNTYVRFVDITDEMRAQDDLIDGKLPFEVCESTDEGAIWIEDYVTLKNWEIK